MGYEKKSNLFFKAKASGMGALGYHLHTLLPCKDSLPGAMTN
jgi:hypothetical protein